MTADSESPVLEHLRHIRGRVDQIARDVTDLKHRMTSLEGAMALVRQVPVSNRPIPREAPRPV